MIVATDAPLIATQLDRIAQRAVMGIARVGGVGEHSSGDLVLAFSTANVSLPVENLEPARPFTTSVEMTVNAHLSPLFEATADATEAAGDDVRAATFKRANPIGLKGGLDVLQRVSSSVAVGDAPLRRCREAFGHHPPGGFLQVVRNRFEVNRPAGQTRVLLRGHQTGPEHQRLLRVARICPRHALQAVGDDGVTHVGVEVFAERAQKVERAVVRKAAWRL